MPETIGWVGLGKMGLPMAQRLLNAGYPLHVWARNPEQTLSLRKQGAKIATDLIELAHRGQIICTILGDTHDVESVYRGMAPGIQPDTVFIDMTTAAPQVAARITALVAAKNAHFIDAPVTGGVAGAAAGTLTHFVGGNSETLQRCEAFLANLGQRSVYCGLSGSGYRMKLVNQTIIAGVFLGLAQGIALARASHFDLELVTAALNKGTASGMLFNSYAERMMEGSGDVTFTLGMLRKDLRLAQAEAELQQKQSLFLKFAVQCLNTACERFGPQAGVQMLSQLER
ncbi:NAD(P)-dependent oxidoreductase [Candidimonas sp. SYP-B2681]|uniref:NAD(P)-dependent oxidoreductase n=1 Tax=Candidimonas sp. SYP-B2681 TaxID=2497686 RepID=UPI000F85C829|nr:NAD(P)-dependent oxidoreductase [Candidimonas sp. SYP-B2681]RTZ45606.1 NAD(P)-dependent oxidoreductase [Candidimonas sp. SYP-B2681]